MKDSVFLTIGIASYNYGRYLSRAFDAIRAQSFQDFEILYCDDGSTDDSVSRIRKFMQDYPEMRIRLIEGENAGVMENKNRILENARGQYVMLCDADDWMEPDCLAELCGRAMQTGADQVVGSFQNVDENGRVLQVQNVPAVPTKWTWGVHHATIYNMAIIRAHHLRMEPGAYPDDVHFNMVFHQYSNEIQCVNKVLYNWYTHSGSASARSAKKDMWHGAAMLHSTMEYIPPIYQAEQDPEERRKIEYMAAKMYGLAVYYRSPGASCREFLRDYRESRNLMDTHFPGWRKNPYVSRADGGGLVRARTAQIIWFTSVLEKLHLMPLALAGYWGVSHFVAFGI